MGRFFSVRNSLLLIAGIGTALLLTLGSRIWLDAWSQASDATRLQVANSIDDLLLTSAFHWANERTLVQAALYAPEPIQPWNRQAIEADRRTADEAFLEAISRIENSAQESRLAQLLSEAKDLYARVNELRGQLDTALENAFDGRNESALSEWFPAMTVLIAVNQNLQQQAVHRGSEALRDVEALQGAKTALAAMWEMAQREAGLIAGIIAADHPIVLEDVERLAEFRGQLVQAWGEVENYSRRADAPVPVVEQIARVRDEYFAGFERIRQPIVFAGMEGAMYPVSAGEWIHQSDAAIRPLLSLRDLFAKSSAELTSRKLAEGGQKLILASVVLAVAILIGAGALWIAIFWITRPLSRVTRAMIALASGEDDVEIPATKSQNEIGDMLRAVQSFKDSLEERAREITKANRELRSLNEGLEERVRQRTDELRATRDEAIQANRAKSQFLANMSHELRTPLNAIIGFSEVLREKVATNGPKDFQDPLERIAVAGQHLVRLINDVLDIAKIEAGKMELNLGAVALPPLFEDVAKTIRPLAEANNNVLSVTCDAEFARVKADPVRLRQILLNLLANAVKFTERGRIELTAMTEKDQIVISVADTGIGMTPEQIDNLFIEFVQADSSSTRKYGGTGLGLAISQRFCRLMGGEITAESTIGQGSTFRVFLATAEPDDRSLEPSTVQEVAAEADWVVLPADDGTGSALVLSIDDDPNALELLELVLKNEGYRLVTARGGSAGLKLVKTLKPDIVTLDVLMPDMDGWDVLAALKANQETQDIPVVMLTIVDEATRGYALGAAEYLMKPIDREMLLSAVSRVVGHKKKPSVLLVEDDEPTRAMVRQMLDGEFAVLVEAVDGEEGLARLAEDRFDVILLDLLMPKMDGFEFLEALRADESSIDIPIIVVTAKDLTSEDHKRLEGAVSKVVKKKAVSGRALLKEIRTVVRNGLAQSREKRVDGDAFETARREHAVTVETEGETSSPIPPDRLRILYVEDNEDNIVLLQGRLVDRGYNVSIARDGREGVATARVELPDLILMDMSLPVMDGWDATRELKRDPVTADIPIIGVSAHAMAGDRDSALAAGCDDYVIKPIDVGELIQKARALMKTGEGKRS